MNVRTFTKRSFGMLFSAMFFSTTLAACSTHSPVQSSKVFIKGEVGKDSADDVLKPAQTFNETKAYKLVIKLPTAMFPLSLVLSAEVEHKINENNKNKE
jgi:outer membrane PBP1 activator LpoA protein